MHATTTMTANAAMSEACDGALPPSSGTNSSAREVLSLRISGRGAILWIGRRAASVIRLRRRVYPTVAAGRGRAILRAEIDLSP